MIPDDLREESHVCVHFIRPWEEAEIGSLGEKIKIFSISLKNFNDEADLLSKLAEEMNFPDYFGRNWDALEECLNDLEWIPASGYVLFIRDSGSAWGKSPYSLGMLISIWLAAAKNWSELGVPFHLIFIV